MKQVLVKAEREECSACFVEIGDVLEVGGSWWAVENVRVSDDDFLVFAVRTLMPEGIVHHAIKRARMERVMVVVNGSVPETAPAPMSAPSYYRGVRR